MPAVDQELSPFAELVGYVRDPLVAGDLFAAAVAADPACSTPPVFPVGPPLPVARASRRWPVAWAEAVAAAFDPSADDADGVLRCLLGDRRVRVRRELASVRRLPPWACTVLLSEAVEANDAETASDALVAQRYEPAELLELFVGVEDLRLSDLALVAFASTLVEDRAAAVRFVAEARSEWLVSAVLRAAVRGGHGPDAAHFCDLAAAATSRSCNPVSLGELVALVLALPTAADRQMISWVSDVVGALPRDPGRELRDDALRDLTDADRIVAWWGSGVVNVRCALLSGKVPASAAVTDALLASRELRFEGTEAVELAGELCRFERYAWPSHGPSCDEAAVVLGRAVELLQRARDGGAHLGNVDAWRVVNLAVTLIDEGRCCDVAVASLEKLVEWVPREVGPYLCRVDVGAMLAGKVDVAEAPPGAVARLSGLVARVAARPGHFGVSANDVVECARTRSWEGASPELWRALVSNTAKVPAAALEWQVGLLTSTVVSVLEERLGGAVDAWRSVAALAPTWEGTVLELADVALTFDGV